MARSTKSLATMNLSKNLFAKANDGGTAQKHPSEILGPRCSWCRIDLNEESRKTWFIHEKVATRQILAEWFLGIGCFKFDDEIKRPGVVTPVETTINHYQRR